MDKLIFIVDDTDLILTKIAFLLEDDYNILTMSSSEKMFKLLTKKIPDLILLDVEMPDTSGFETINKLKEHPEWQNIPVMFLTGYIDNDIKTRSEQSGALEVICKSVSKTALLRYVRDHIK